MIKFLRAVLLIIIAITCVKIFSQTIDNGIDLRVTKTTNMMYHLEWVDHGQGNLAIYKVYASTDPSVLGHMLAVVRGNQYDVSESTQTQILWYFQIERVGI